MSVAFVSAVTPASATLSMRVTPDFGSSLGVGQAGAPASLTITNTSTGIDALTPITLGTIALVPSCGSQTPVAGGCPAAAVDPDVLRLSATGTGSLGGACSVAGFTLGEVDPVAGSYTFTPAVPVLLGPPGTPAASCEVTFTADVLRTPAHDANPGLAGAQTDQIAAVAGTAASGGAVSAVGVSEVTVGRGQVALATHVTPAVLSLGGSFHDTATLTPPAAGPAPTGTVRFDAYGPGDPTCAGPPAATTTTSLDPSGTTAASGAIAPSRPGTYTVVASYGGDASYAPVAGACGDPAETVTVAKASLALTTQVSPAAVAVGGSFHDTATLAAQPPGLPVPTGSVTFSLYGPGDGSCAGPVVATATDPLDASGTVATSDAFTARAAGGYRIVASYGGDADYAAAVSACADPAEAVTVTRATLGVSTQVAPASIALGGSFDDTATLAGVPAGAAVPTGSVTFTAYGPNDAMCAGPPAAQSTVAVAAGAVSGALTPGAAGVYHVVASYTGDANYAPATSACADPGESVVVGPATLALAAQVAPSTISLGGSFRDRALLAPPPAGAAAPTGTVTFDVYVPGDATCAGAPFAASTVALDASGAAVSAAFAPALAGVYRVVASYGGDANYAAAATACGAPGGSETVGPASPTLASAVSPSAVTLGATFAATAALSVVAGAAPPSGSITFDVYGPADVSCAGPPVASLTGPLDAAGATAASGDILPVAAGTYSVVARYAGDADYAAAVSACAAGVTVGRATVGVAASAAPAALALGASFSATATLGTPPAGVEPPSGTVTFAIYADPSCSGPVAFSSTVPLGASSAAFTPSAAGTYRVVATYAGDGNYTSASSPCADPAAAAVVDRAAPAIATTVAPGAITLGAGFHATATLGPRPGGAAAPTGTVAFDVYAPDDSACAGVPAFSSSVALGAPSGTFTPAAAGAYRVTASYSGDANYAPAASACTDPAARVDVARAPLAVATQVSPSTLTLGASFGDTATLGPPPAGAATPTGSVTFDVYGPGDPTCAGPALASSLGALDAAGTTAVAQSFRPQGAGGYRVIASYGGDGNYAGSTSACADPAALASVGRAPVGLSAQASPAAITLGDAFTDTATLGAGPPGAVAPTGSVSFASFGPDDPTCAGTPAATTTVTLGAGGVGSVALRPSRAGTYAVVASYAGDGNYAPSASACGDPAQAVTVARATLAVTAQVAPPAALLGGSVHATATLGPLPAGAVAPTGSVTFTVYDDPACSGTPAAGSTDPLDGGGTTAASDAFPLATAGTRHVVASYGGDANYAPASSACADPAAAVTVDPASLGIAVTVTPGTLVLGGSVAATATLGAQPAGAAPPSGSVTFDVYGPGDATCSQPAVLTATGALGATAALHPVAAGTYRIVARFAGDADYLPAATACADPAGALVVTPATLPVAAHVDPVALGAPLVAVATLAPAPAGAIAPTGTVTFRLYGPGGGACAGPAALTATGQLDASGGVSGDLLPPHAGSYDVVASYAGDGSYAAAESPCVAVAVAPATLPVSARAAPAAVAFGGAFHATATLGAPPAGAAPPTGDVTFAVFSPDDVACVGTPLMTANAPLGADLSATSGDFAPVVAGAYRVVARYAGDADYAAGASACQDPAAAATVGRAGPPSITTTVRMAADGTLTATAKLAPVPAGAPAPTGTVTFAAFRDATALRAAESACDASPAAFTSTAPLDAGGTSAVSAPFTPTAAGTYRFQATYGGDANYPGVASACADPAGAVTITAPSLAVTLTADPASRVEPGGDFTFTLAASAAGGFGRVAVTRLSDSVYGDLTARPGSTCGALVSAPLTSGSPARSCTFVGSFTGSAGARQTDTVSLAGASGALAVSQSAQATVSLTAAPAVPPAPAAATPPPAPAAATPPLPRGGVSSSAASARTPAAAAAPRGPAGPAGKVAPRAGLAHYDARTQPRKVVGVEVATFALLALVGAAGGAAARRVAPRPRPAHQAGGGANFDVDYEGADVVYLGAAAGVAIGDRSRTWGWPGTRAIDAASVALPMRLAGRAPLLARVAEDGAYLRSIFGSAALAAQVGGVVLGIAAVDQTGGRALPPGTALTIAIAVLGVLDAGAGLLAVLTFAAGVALAGGLSTAPELRTLLALCGLWFVVAVIAGAARPLRRDPPADAKGRFDRAADFVIASLIGAWAVQKLVVALPGLSGYALPIGGQANTVALWILGALLVRMLGETAAAHLYPRRLVTVQPADLREPGPVQRLAAAGLRTAIFVFVAEVVVGSTWQLWVAGLLFLVPQALGVFAERLPRSERLGRVLPEGLLELVVMLFLLTGLGALLLSTHAKGLIADSFVLLAIPGAVLAVLHNFGGGEEEGDDGSPGSWAPRLAGIAVLAAGVLQALGLLF